jgi:hypothetical protein
VSVDDFDYQAAYAGPCTCPPECPNHVEDDCYDEECTSTSDDDNARERHSWGSCGATLPDGTKCPCEAGWEE